LSSVHCGRSDVTVSRTADREHADEQTTALLLETLRRVEEEPTLLGASDHR
jgi:hypothetical protein